MVIGVSENVDPMVRSLGDAVANDAEDLATLLAEPGRCGFLPDDVVSLTHEEPTLSAIRRALEWLVNAAEEDDLVVIFFSGHGARNGDHESFFCPRDFDGRRAEETGLTGEEFSRRLQRLQARRLLVLLDACHAGGLGHLKGAAERLKPGLPEAFYASLEAPGRFIIASSRQDQASHILPAARNSLFTGAVLEGLRGAARKHGRQEIKVLDLFDYVRQAMGKHGLEQNPVCHAKMENDFVIAWSNDHVPEELSVEEWNAFEQLACELYRGGPHDIWERAGGDPSRLEIGGTARHLWREATRLLRNGGGGATLNDLLGAMLDEYGKNSALLRLRDRLVGPPAKPASRASSLGETGEGATWKSKAVAFAEAQGAAAREALAHARNGDRGERLLRTAMKEGTPPHLRRTLLEAAAAFDAPDACQLLGQSAWKGLYEPRSKEAAGRWFRRGADLGSPSCMYLLSELLRGDDKRRSEAETLLRAAAEGGSADARLERARQQLSALSHAEQDRGLQELNDLVSVKVDGHVLRAARCELARALAFGADRWRDVAAARLHARAVLDDPASNNGLKEVAQAVLRDRS